MSGPMTEATPNTALKTPWKMGRLLRGTVSTMVLMLPLNIPADPKPAVIAISMSASDKENFVVKYPWLDQL